MKLARWHAEGAVQHGFEVGGRWYRLESTLADLRPEDDWPTELQASSGGLARAALALDAPGLDVGQQEPIEAPPYAAVAAPIWGDVAIFCASLNYHSHVRETGLGVPDEPFFFLKRTRCVVAPEQPIALPPQSTKPDYEAELAVVIGVEGKNIDLSDALDHVAGYTMLNDISFRDLQVKRDGDRMVVDWVSGKCLDMSAPAGPWLVTKADVPEPDDVRLTLRVNGELRQRCEASDMVFGVRQLVAAASRGITLHPGDVIATGTCAGVGSASGRFLKPGDQIEIESESLGTLRTPVVAAESPQTIVQERQSN